MAVPRPREGVCGGANFFGSLYSQRVVFAFPLSAFFIFVVTENEFFWYVNKKINSKMENRFRPKTNNNNNNNNRISVEPHGRNFRSASENEKGRKRSNGSFSSTKTKTNFRQSNRPVNRQRTVVIVVVVVVCSDASLPTWHCASVPC